MEVQLTGVQQAFAQQGIDSGRYGSELEAVNDALAMWEEQERRQDGQSVDAFSPAAGTQIGIRRNLAMPCAGERE